MAAASSASSSPPPRSSSSSPVVDSVDVSSFVLQQARLVSQERSEDVSVATASVQQMAEKEAVKAGLCLPRLRLSECRTGLYGRCLVTFEPAVGDLLPATQIAVRDIVHIAHKQAQAASSVQGWWKDGVVFRQTERTIVVAVEEYPEPEERLGQFSLTRVANELVYQRYSIALKELQDRGVHGPQSNRVLQLLYGDAVPSSIQPPVDVVLSPNGRLQRLNDVQQRAISRALSSNDVFVLHGPPGTGKTTTLVELIVQSVARGERVLACAPSNIAVDNLVERVTAAVAYNASHSSKASSASSSSPTFHGFRCIRVGHPARLSASVLSHSLDSVVAQSDGGQITRDIEQELANTQRSINTTKDRAEKKTLRSQWKSLQKELRERQKKAVKDALDACSVICTTLVGSASSACSAYRYDVVVIDEAAQAIEVACLIPILLCSKRLVLAGDHCQLGPVVKSKEAERGGLGRTLMDRLTARKDRDELMLMLDEQYRMAAPIMDWTSAEFYHSKLRAPDDVRQRRLVQVSDVRDEELTRAAIVLVDTAGCDMYEEDEGGDGDARSLLSQSKSNQHEAALVLRHIRMLLAAGVPLSSITVLSPYLAQISVLRDLLLPLWPALEVGTIDSMQGRENDAVIISAVRSNAARVVGFLSESRRMNVAVTRAKRQVCIIGDSDTLANDPFLKRLVDYAMECEQAEYVSALEYLDDRSAESVAHVSPPATTRSPVPAAPSTREREERTVKAATVHKELTRTDAAEAVVAAVSEGVPVIDQFDRERMVEWCREVLSGARASFTFPASLSSDERRVVHEVAEEVGQGGLVHSAEGPKHKRVITLRKHSPASPKPTVESAGPQSTSKQPPHQSSAPTSRAAPVSREQQRQAALDRMEAAAKPQQRLAMPTTVEATPPAPPADRANVATISPFQRLAIDDDDDECKDEPQPEEERKQAASIAAQLSPCPATAALSKKKSKQAKAAALPAEDEGLDSFLDSLAKGVSVCASPSCSKPVMVNGAVCRFCNLRFCLSHANSILHGCSAEAKEDALARDMRAYHASQQGRSAHGLKPEKREQLASKAQAKAKELRKANETPSKKRAEEKKKS